MARVGPEFYEKLCKKKHARPMDFTGKPIKGMMYIEPEGLKSDNDLKEWIDIYLDFISTLPPKK